MPASSTLIIPSPTVVNSGSCLNDLASSPLLLKGSGLLFAIAIICALAGLSIIIGHSVQEASLSKVPLPVGIVMLVGGLALGIAIPCALKNIFYSPIDKQEKTELKENELIIMEPMP